MKPYIYALMANLTFALGSIFFTHYARRFSSTWINTYKALVAAGLFGITIILTSGFHQISGLNFGVFFLSGFIALGLGDIFLIKAFAQLGPGRTMVLFGFHPIVVGGISYFIFGQVVDLNKLLGIGFFILCLMTYAYEGFKKSGHWEVWGLVFAVLGMGLDGVGVTITRYGFDMNSELTAFEGNLYRCIGALFCYLLIGLYRPFNFFAGFKELKISSRAYVFLGAFLGTYLSLAFYLEAIKTAHLASVSAISITSVIFASLFESVWEKQWPSKYLWISFLFFTGGMYFIL